MAAAPSAAENLSLLNDDIREFNSGLESWTQGDDVTQQQTQKRLRAVWRDRGAVLFLASFELTHQV